MTHLIPSAPLRKFARRCALVALAALCAGLFSGPAPVLAQDEDAMKARHVIDEAKVAVERVRAEHKPSDQLESMLAKARGVLVIPSYYKAGFIVGVSYGDGVLLKRQRDGTFGDPAFYRMTSGSIGLQAGMQSAETMFLILTDKGMQAMLDDEFKLGANVGISVGTVGAGTEASTTTNIGNDIVAYSSNAGLFAGGAFEGSVIKPRKDFNAAVYGIDSANPEGIVNRAQLFYADGLKKTLVSQVYAQEPQVN